MDEIYYFTQAKISEKLNDFKSALEYYMLIDENTTDIWLKNIAQEKMVECRNLLLSSN